MSALTGRRLRRLDILEDRINDEIRATWRAMHQARRLVDDARSDEAYVAAVTTTRLAREHLRFLLSLRCIRKSYEVGE